MQNGISGKIVAIFNIILITFQKNVKYKKVFYAYTKRTIEKLVAFSNIFLQLGGKFNKN